MDRKQGSHMMRSALVKFLANMVRVNVECLGINIHKDRGCAGADDRTRRSEEAECRRDHSISGLYTRRSQSQPQGIGTRGAADGVLGAGKFCDLALEAFYLRSQDELLRIADAFQCSQNLFSNRRILASQVEERNRFNL